MDRDLLEDLKIALRKNDTSLLGRIYEKHRLPFVKFASRYEVSNDEVIDIYQDAILALRDNVVNGTVKKLDCTIKTYLFSIGKFMLFKRYKDLNLLNALTEETIMEVAYDFPYEDSALQDELQEKIDEHFEQLGDKCQKVLKLFYYDGFTLEEIQKQLNYDNYNVVKSQKSRCLKTLKELISKHQNDR